MAEGTDFITRSEDMMARYSAGQFAEALEITERLAAEFPEEDPSTSLWRLCLLARLGRRAEALKVMSEALNRGVWWLESQLRADEDLASLQGMPEYESMVAQSRRRMEAAQQLAKPEMLFRRPPGSEPHPLLVALHGRLSSAQRQMQHWEPVLQMGWALAMPQSSQVGSAGTFLWDDRARAIEEIKGHLESLMADHSIDRRLVILGGFSQGAGLAMHLCLSRHVAARGFLAVAPGRDAVEGLEAIDHPASSTRAYVVLGGRDPRHGEVAPISGKLNRMGVACEVEDYPELGHFFPQDFAETLRRAFGFLLGSGAGSTADGGR